MSSTRNVTHKCQHCGKEFDITIYGSVNGTLDPELKEKLFTSELFAYECPHCHRDDFVFYPVCYHDMEKKFMVHSGSAEFLLAMNETVFKDENAPLRAFGDLGKDYKIWGATSYLDLRNKIFALERGYDPRIMQFAILCAKDYAEDHFMDADGKKDEIKYVYLLPNDDSCIVAIEMENGKIGYLNVDEIYKNIEADEMIVGLKKTDEFLFDDDALMKYLGEAEIKDKDMETKDLSLCVLETEDGNKTVALIPSFNKGKFAESDVVICEDSDRFVVGKIVRLFEVNRYKYPRSGFLWVARKMIGKEMTTSQNSDCEIDNADLMRKIIEKSDTPAKHLPYAEMCNADFILAAQVTMPIAPDKLHELLKAGEISADESIRKELKSKRIDGKSYLCIYSSQKDFPSESEFSREIYKFDDIAELIFNAMPFGGIVINAETDGVLISYSQLNDYKYFKILEDADKMRELLPKLNEAEITYIGKEIYEIIKKSYFYDPPISELAKESGTTKDELRKKLDEAYEKIMDIIRLNY